ncbi:LAME_0F17172g1_1 [Lachancea meyersii CBS 8951]|uniref:Protein IBD2 n=1 Tax=Lachancea meyersii CBS 8951 TaxID=1266667 RepID=A0A1G4JZQ5_9SACH|nr:LAME_0F17172g1_1 [Lachancea meyersii CBS 8951]
MPSFKKTSAKGFPEDGRAEFSVMMQEGVKALTNMLTNHLQESPGFRKHQSMEMYLGNALDSEKDSQRVFEVTESEETPDKDGDEFVEFTSSQCKDEAERTQLAEQVRCKSKGNSGVVRKGPMPRNTANASHHRRRKDVQRDEEQGQEDQEQQEEEEQIVFDTGEQELLSFPGEFSDNLKKMVASSIAQHGPHGTQPNIDFDFDVDVDVDVNMTESPLARNDRPATLAQPAGTRHSRSHCCHEALDTFEYPRGTKTAPDFSKLINNDKPMCMFCEYYVVFGEPPKNMIRWFDRVRGQGAPAPHAHSHAQR